MNPILMGSSFFVEGIALAMLVVGEGKKIKVKVN